MLLKDELALVREAVDRTRRIETRLTTFMIEHGMTPRVQKPQRNDLTITIPSMRCSIHDIILSARQPARFALWHAGHQIGFLDLWEEGVRQATTMSVRKGVASDSDVV